VPSERKQIDLKASYWLHGEGPIRVIVLHGWFVGSQVFEPMLAALDPERFSLAFVDYRGYGGALMADGPYTIETIADDVACIANQLGWSRFAVVGHSMGGKAALRVAVDMGPRITQILGLTPVFAEPAPFGREQLALFRSAAHDPTARAAILNHSTGGLLPANWSNRMAAKSFKTSQERAFADYFESWAFSDFSQEVVNLSQEVLAVAGEHDAGVTEAAVKASWIAKLPNARFRRISGSGHYPMLETPLTLAAVFEEFLHSSET
jgi:pimeloyl-ACP methyl ester carboxylesterase